MPTLDEVRNARRWIEQDVQRTLVLTCQTIDRLAKARVFFKCENFQKSGSFKFRGAYHAIKRLTPDQRIAGVATHSSGNHAQALALAGAIAGVPVHVVMPSNAPSVKRAAVRDYGAAITFCEPTLEARESTTADVIRATGATMIHPYDNDHVIAGQGTCALELMEEITDLGAIICPLGGGGLLSGTLLAAKGTNASIRVFGVEPKAADDGQRSLRENRIVPVGNPITVADGLRTSLGERTFPIIRQWVDEILTVEESEIVEAMRLVMERMKMVIEPSGAVPLAALLSHRARIPSDRIGVIVSGGNVDLSALPWALPDRSSGEGDDHGWVHEGK